MSRWLAVALGVVVASLMSGCATVSYLAQSAAGHLQIMRAARPVPEVVADTSTPEALRKRLELSQRMRDFAIEELKLPDNDSYRRYADLQRGAAVWNVVAAPELSLQLQTWCFPVVGCVGYRGYFDRARADAAAEELRGQGLEAGVYGVPAYSTLGFLNWLGGDPLLNTFIRYPDGELARMIFHELAHQVVYAKGDTLFNESFATSVEQIGGSMWLKEQADVKAREEFARYDARRREFRALTMRYRQRLDALYRSAASDADKRDAKAKIMAELRADHERLKAERWGGYTGYDDWFKNANNASFGVLAAYTDEVPDFERLFEREGRDFARFYDEVKRLAALPKDERHATLRANPVAAEQSN
jgi:predicted aminopeptidase